MNFPGLAVIDENAGWGDESYNGGFKLKDNGKQTKPGQSTRNGSLPGINHFWI